MFFVHKLTKVKQMGWYTLYPKGPLGVIHYYNENIGYDVTWNSLT